MVDHIRSIAICPGGYAFLKNRSGYSYHNIPQDCAKKIESLSDANKYIKCVAFTPRGDGWAVIWSDFGSECARCPSGAVDCLIQLEKREKDIDWITFGPGDSWLILSEGKVFSGNIPNGNNVVRRLRELSGSTEVEFVSLNRSDYVIWGEDKTWRARVDDEISDWLENAENGAAITSLALSPSGEWALADAQGDFAFSRGVCCELKEALQRNRNRGRGGRGVGGGYPNPSRAPTTILFAAGHGNIGHDGSDSEPESESEPEDRIYGGRGQIVSIPRGITLHTYTPAGKLLYWRQIYQVYEQLRRTGTFPKEVEEVSGIQGSGPFKCRAVVSGDQTVNYIMTGDDEQQIAGVHVFRPGQHQRPEFDPWPSRDIKGNLKGLIKTAQKVGATDIVMMTCRR